MTVTGEDPPEADGGRGAAPPSRIRTVGSGAETDGIGLDGVGLSEVGPIAVGAAPALASGGATANSLHSPRLIVSASVPITTCVSSQR